MSSLLGNGLGGSVGTKLEGAGLGCDVGVFEIGANVRKGSSGVPTGFEVCSGLAVRSFDGRLEGIAVGFTDGLRVGRTLGASEGRIDGMLVGAFDVAGDALGRLHFSSNVVHPVLLDSTPLQVMLGLLPT